MTNEKPLDQPYTTVCRVPGSQWFGKKTMCVYGPNDERVCTVPRWTGKKFLSKAEARQKAEEIARLLNKSNSNLTNGSRT